MCVNTQSFANIYNSDGLGLGTVNSAAKTVILSGGANVWPTDIVDYYISFANDGYVKNYIVTARGSTTSMTFLDALNSSPSGSQKWLIRGTPKGEVVNMLSYVLYYAPMTDQAYKTWRNEQDSTGANA